MRALFFGPSGRRLYGVYHEPEVPRRAAPAVLLCYPGVHEYNTAHWTFRRLATGLAKAGCPSLRFDYRGTGDSDGEPTDLTIESMVEDTLQAARELQDLSGARRLCLVGLRLGATAASLAAQAAGDLPIRGLVMWEWISQGSEYVHELEERDRVRNILLLHGPSPDKPRPELLGYEMSERSQSSLTSLALLDRLEKAKTNSGPAQSPLERVTLLPRGDQDPAPMEAYWREQGTNVSVYRTTDIFDPARGNAGTDVRLDPDAIRAITSAIGGKND